MKIGFIFPSSDYLHDPFRGDPHTHFHILTILEEHFGDKLELSLIDLRGIKREFAFLHIYECDVYLHSVYTLDYEEQKLIAESLRIRYPKAIHVAGGPHVNIYRKEALKVFDSLIIGEGETAIIQVINDIMNFKLKPIYDLQEKVDINQYPFPSRKYLPSSAIARRGLITTKGNGYDKLLTTSVLFSRGCPYKCVFCAMSVEGYMPGIRYRSPENIQNEIEYLKREYKVEGIALFDDIAIPLSTRKSIPHLEAIGRTNVKWKAQSRTDGMTPDLAKLAKESGCVTIGMGVESVSQKVLDIINKNIDINEARKTIHFLKLQGIECRIYLIMGLPGEEKDVVKKTLEFIDETEPDLVTLSLFTPRPGTEVFNNPKKFGIKNIGENWEKKMHLVDRYKYEAPAVTFEYEDNSPWGKSLTGEQIIKNFQELHTAIKERGLSSAISPTTAP